jgi:integrase/recombinase XerC
VALLRPEEQVLEAMLDGWRNQQLARNLARSAIDKSRAAKASDALRAELKSSWAELERL